MPRSSDVIFVTNKSGQFHSDMFDGEEYSFPVNEKVPVPIDAATHMLGFNLKDKTETLVRLGWAMKFDGQRGFVDNPEGTKRLSKFVFSRAVMVEEQVDANGKEAAAA
jgi:hypothetical protein